MKTVKINREFVEMFYFCPQLAYIQFFGQKKIFDVNKKLLTFNKFSDFTDEFYLHKMYTKILTFIFFNHKETGTIEYDFIVNLVSQFLNEETNKRYEKYNDEILQNVKPIIKMFEPKDSILIKHNTIKDKLDLTKHMEKYFSGQPEPIFDKVLLNGEKKFVYEIEIPFIITENNSTQSCVPILFVNKEIENCCNPYDINSLLTMLYIKENSFYHIFNKVIFYFRCMRHKHVIKTNRFC